MSEMPNQPTVACIMLANGRPEMCARAMKCFDAQTYDNRIDVIWDNDGSRSIGALRNEANRSTDCDIICHWDSDDWSHPDRIAEQVALLQSSGAECVGYNEMLFWFNAMGCSCFKSPGPPWYAAQCRKPLHHVGEHDFGTQKQNHARFWKNEPISFINADKITGAPINNEFGEAWVYTMAFEPQRYAMGASMCYWRETWERHPFPDQSAGCDDLFWFNAKLNIRSVSAFQNEYGILKEPAMICGMHGSNTCASAAPGAKEWTRMPACDGYAREAMKL